MHVSNTPEDIIRLAQRDELTTQMVLNNQIERVQNVLRCRRLNLTREERKLVIACIEEFAGISIDAEAAREFVELFPEVITNVVISNKSIDTATRELILHCLCNMLLGCDFREDEVLLDLLYKQALKIWPDASKFVTKPE